jgi:protein-S-isoprenylcysteine O-methyltransferase Ste14
MGVAVDEGTGTGSAPTRSRLVAIALFALGAMLPLAALGFAGRLDWWPAWVLALIQVGAGVLGRYLVWRRHPDLLQERMASARAKDALPGDRKMAGAISLLGPAVILAIAGLDERLGWSANVPLPVQWLGVGLVLTGYVLGTWAIRANRFFSGVVRLQVERGHTVVDEGPYGLVRHPGYVGALIAMVGAPLLLDSLWALVPSLLTAALVFLRTHREDTFLQANLPGYPAYCQRTPYRLVPCVW